MNGCVMRFQMCCSTKHFAAYTALVRTAWLFRRVVNMTLFQVLIQFDQQIELSWTLVARKSHLLSLVINQVMLQLGQLKETVATNASELRKSLNYVYFESFSLFALPWGGDLLATHPVNAEESRGRERLCNTKMVMPTLSCSSPQVHMYMLAIAVSLTEQFDTDINNV